MMMMMMMMMMMKAAYNAGPCVTTVRQRAQRDDQTEARQTQTHDACKLTERGSEGWMRGEGRVFESREGLVLNKE